jgi:hypothetical protein
MSIWAITNPSDPYTIESETFPAAAAAVLLLGEGRFGLAPEDKKTQGMPLLMFGGGEAFIEEHFGGDLRGWIHANMPAVIDALDSVLLGGFGRRADYRAAIEAIDDPAKLASFKSAWQDKRSSRNDIGGSAHRLAAHLRERSLGSNQDTEDGK